MSEFRLACCYCIHDDWWYFEESLASFAGPWQTVVFLSSYPWGGKPGDIGRSREIAENSGATVIEGIWITENEQRRVMLDWLRANNYTHALLPDSDELIEVQLLDTLVRIAQNNLADRVYVSWESHWYSPEYVIRPPERFTPLILVNTSAVHQVHLRDYAGGRPMYLGPDHGKMEHLSYCGPEQRVVRKVTSWGHKDQVVNNWIGEVFKKWTGNRMLRNLNPVDPGAYGFAERTPVPEILKGAYQKWLSYTKDTRDPVVPCANWPTISVVIPLHGGKEEIARCLTCLEDIADLLHEIIVVDNGSSPDVLDDVRKHKVQLIELGSNKGFSFATNRGIEASTGTAIMMLNSDCYVNRVAILRMANSMMASAAIAGAGPYTNRAGHGQQIEPTYFDVNHAGLFAEDFAMRQASDIDRDMLVAFCVLFRRSAIEEVGLLDEVRFESGLWADNDICYRLRRQGYRLVLSTRSYVHHEGSKTLGRLGLNIEEMLRRDEFVYRQKWQLDIDMKFADTLSGLRAEPIVFDQSRKPETVIELNKEKVARAKISMCLIVKNEELNIRRSVGSLIDLFHELIVLDTGSTDTTLEILAEYPQVKAFQAPWEQSFSVARNQVQAHASGDFIAWIDADDLMPMSTALTMTDLALNCPPHIGGFYAEVRYLEKPADSSVRVDHVKLYRRHPDIRWSNRIHEQILMSIRNAGFELAQTDLCVIHAGYDDSPEVQKRKRERDEPLLHLDLADTPEDSFKMWNLGMSYHYWNEHELAIDWFKKCIAHSRIGETQIGPAFSLWASSLVALGRKQEAFSKAKEGLGMAPGFPELHYKLGQWCLELGAFREAKHNFRKCLDTNRKQLITSVDQGIFGFKSLLMLGNAEMGLGQYAAAKDCWLKAMNEAPAWFTGVQELFRGAMTAKDFPVVNALIERIRTNEGYSQFWADCMGEYQDAIAGPGSGIGFLSTLLEQNPGYHAVRLSLAMRLIEAKRLGEAVQHLSILDRHNVPPASFHLGKLSMANADYKSALAWITRSQSLDPAHVETADLIAKLTKLMETEAVT